MPAHRVFLAFLMVGACGGAGVSGAPDAPDTNSPDGRLPSDAPPPPSGASLVFESGPVRPLALSPDGARLFVANTGNGTLDILTVGASGLAKEGSVAVGVEPVAVAARTNTEVWVVNQISD